MGSVPSSIHEDVGSEARRLMQGVAGRRDYSASPGFREQYENARRTPEHRRQVAESVYEPRGVQELSH